MRVQCRRRATTRPGTLLRQQIPLRTDWNERVPGFLEVDTVAMCGGVLDDRHGWMFDAVDIHTTWNEMRGLPNRSEAATLEGIADVEASLQFALRREVDRQLREIEAQGHTGGWRAGTDWIDRRSPRNGSEGGRRAPGFPLSFVSKLRGNLGNTIFESTGALSGLSHGNTHF
ncbi:MAG: hypothetical protein GX456_03400 [Verrucomicrobia bacterium]|nr:hypothetical protein [Verrucomicrobiota bacterium]